MGGLQMEKIFEIFRGLESETDLQDIPWEQREEFRVFMRIMKARTLSEMKGISYETILGLFEKIPLFASYLDIRDISMADLQLGFCGARSDHFRHVM